MSRTLKRVPLDFKWPLKKIWGGYINPFNSQSVQCQECRGTGESPEYLLLRDRWYGNVEFRPEERGSTPFSPDHPVIVASATRNVERSPDFYGTGKYAVEKEANRLCEFYNSHWSRHLNEQDVRALLEANRLMDFTHTFSDGKWKVKNPPYVPTAKEVNEWSIVGMGHDSIDSWVVVSAECKRLGYETQCHACSGDGVLWPSPLIKRRSKRWKNEEPPVGDGFQLWETTSEGSPVSPVFTTLDELCSWCEGNACTFADNKATAEEWKKMLDADFVHHTEGNMTFI